MRRNALSVALFVLSVLALCLARVTSVVAASPTAVVVFMCADYGTWSVVFYDHSSGAPGQIAGASCATQLASLLGAGFTNVNVTTQTYSSTTGGQPGAPGGVDGTYITYVLTNGTLTSGNL